MRNSIRPKPAADEARARLNRAERSVELTKNSLSYATLVADTAGVVTATLIEPGQVVTAGQTAIRLARLAEKEVVVAIPETLLTRAKSGEAQVSIWSNPDKRYVAKLRELAPSADAATRTYLAKFSMPDAGDEVQLGMTATLTLSDPQATEWHDSRSRHCSIKARGPPSTSPTPKAAPSRSSVSRSNRTNAKMC